MSPIAKILAGAAAIIVLFVALTALFTIDETETAIVTRFGRPLDRTVGPGLHLKWPWPVESVVRMDARLLIFDNEPTEMLTQDKKNVVIDNFIAWRIDDPLRFAQTVKNRPEAEARLLDIAASEMGAAVGREPIESFINTDASKVKLRELSGQVAKAVDAIARKSFGIEVSDLQINGLNLPPQNRASVIKRMRAERDRIATRYRSEGEEEALKVEARAAAEKERIVADARGKAEAIRGQGEADAMKVFAEAYKKDPDFYRLLRTLQSYERIVDKDTTVFIESNSDLMRYLSGP
ncbi:MAG: protease modulator HflC [Deltaproteobacteria bacterium]|nr:protease modulator HflC [Deltaproteobacteria bacterium]